VKNKNIRWFLAPFYLKTTPPKKLTFSSLFFSPVPKLLSAEIPHTSTSELF
jgi:hypothetical protein